MYSIVHCPIVSESEPEQAGRMTTIAEILREL